MSEIKEEPTTAKPFIVTEPAPENLPGEEIIDEVRKTEPPTMPEKIEIKEISPPALRPEMDTRLSYGVRIVHFLESRKTGDFVKLNDFLKALYPIPKPGFPVEFTKPENMRFLRMTLKQLQESGKIQLSNNSFERLGKHYYEGSNPETKYHNVLTLPIEAKIPQ